MHGLEWAEIVAAARDGGDVVGAGAHGVWEFEVFVDGFSAPGAGEVLAGEDCLAFASVGAVSCSAHCCVVVLWVCVGGCHGGCTRARNVRFVRGGGHFRGDCPQPWVPGW